MDDVIINKTEVINNCINRIKEDYEGFESEFDKNFMRQDAVILNLQRACEASIDLATHIVRVRRLGVPQITRDVFTLLEEEKIISSELSEKMQSMVGFRNIAVHDYQALNFDILKSILNEHLGDFTEFISEILKKVR